MARKTKPRAKPKPKSYTSWTVTTHDDTQQVQIEADDVSINHSLVFEKDGEVLCAFAPGAWTTLYRIEPEPDQD